MIGDGELTLFTRWDEVPPLSRQAARGSVTWSVLWDVVSPGQGTSHLAAGGIGAASLLSSLRSKAAGEQLLCMVPKLPPLWLCEQFKRATTYAESTDDGSRGRQGLLNCCGSTAEAKPTFMPAARAHAACCG